ncbi:hypothetical protein KJS94_16060 [Flavihumibacter rivuli]|uniref:hypothetical protein n=1 Tax=Flavihumibacter rivuli TaxID=2838156 RepID=UPI001BDF222D|nr:hypothetical protein [Flavihumibacter rivuli]ULQ56164.1 hypothetical protein KJS94_16060 [Flavihumibacter rivuli]
MNPNRKQQQYIILFVALLLLFNFPLLSIYNKASLVNKVPLLYRYVFLAWLASILLLFAITETRKEKERRDE